MERNKLEKEFRNKLNKREINPSENSWERLDAMLTAKEEKTKSRYGWIYIAASILGFAFLGTFFFSEKGSSVENQKSTIVIQESVPTKRHKESSSVLNPNPASSENESTVYVGKVAAKDNKKIVLKKDPLTNKDNLNQNQVAELSMINQVKENDIVVNSSEKKSHKSLSENKYVSAEKLLAEVSNAKFEPKATDKIKEKTRRHISVNPNSLLSNAETELNQSYRESALETLTKNFKVIKTVLVNRNYKE